jgi:hypothetical protein
MGHLWLANPRGGQRAENQSLFRQHPGARRFFEPEDGIEWHPTHRRRAHPADGRKQHACRQGPSRWNGQCAPIIVVDETCGRCTGGRRGATRPARLCRYGFVVPRAATENFERLDDESRTQMVTDAPDVPWMADLVSRQAVVEARSEVH